MLVEAGAPGHMASLEQSQDLNLLYPRLWSTTPGSFWELKDSPKCPRGVWKLSHLPPPPTAPRVLLQVGGELEENPAPRPRIAFFSGSTPNRVSPASSLPVGASGYRDREGR